MSEHDCYNDREVEWTKVGSCLYCQCGRRIGQADQPLSDEAREALRALRTAVERHMAEARPDD